ncbi:hypothetical protein C0W52_19945 [Photobacterium kishitanii]|nr:hypothetical protein UA41_17515 [Photobacterium kishitanii]PSX26141.1 hypothetical protein C0W52_19945 [Photobacterium kishitanii]
MIVGVFCFIPLLIIWLLLLEGCCDNRNHKHQSLILNKSGCSERLMLKLLLVAISFKKICRHYHCNGGNDLVLFDNY